MMQQRIRDVFREAFGTEPAFVVRGPGRVNLIGEHTDYNDGFVLPGAVDRAIWVALSPRTDRTCHFVSVDLEERLVVDLPVAAKTATHWANYLLGIYAELAVDGHAPRGVNCVFGGNVPIGSGMSSSAALECAFAFGLNEAFGLGYDRMALARLGQRSENRFVGVNCGIMDHFASVLGVEGHLLHLDCRDLSFRNVPFTRTDVRVVLADTQVRRTLAGSEYNVRRAQCEAGATLLGVKSLRDATPAMVEAAHSRMDDVIYRRCLYVTEENVRVQEACAALERDDLKAFGVRMTASHAGLRDDYEVSSPELDILAEAAQALPGVLGSRMMGAGFGGCTVNLVEETSLVAFQEAMTQVFRAKLDRPSVLHVCSLTGGTSLDQA